MTARRATTLWCRVAVAALALLPFAPHVAVANDGPGVCAGDLKVWVLRRQGQAPRPLTVTLRMAPLSESAIVFVVGTRGSGSRRVVLDDGHAGAVVVNHPTLGAWPYAYHSGSAARRTSAPSVTTPPNSLRELCAPAETYRTVELPQGDAVDHDVYVGAYHEDVTLSISPGWTATPVARGFMRVVLGSADGAGVETAAGNAEYFEGTREVWGGPWGSVAFGTLPCASAAHGVGAARLYGGGPETSSSRRWMRCNDGETAAVGGASEGPAFWRVFGEAVGVSPVRMRLAVFDLPPG